MNTRRKRIIKTLMLGLVITAVFTVGMYFSEYREHAFKIIILGISLSVILSKGYLLPFSFMKTEGTVTEIRVEAYKKFSHGGRPTGAYTAGMNKGSTIKTQRKYEVITYITTDKGKEIIKTFPYDGTNYGMAEGARIRFSPLDEYPEFIK